jgi:hypothetical protein
MNLSERHTVGFGLRGVAESVSTVKRLCYTNWDSQRACEWRALGKAHVQSPQEFCFSEVHHVSCGTQLSIASVVERP